METGFIEWIGIVVLLGGLAWLSIIDIRSFRLPNNLTFPLIFFGLIYHFNISLDLYPFLLGAVLGYAAFWLVETLYRLIRKKDGLGRGDAKLFAAGGAWCGAIALPFIVLIASGAGLAYVLLQPEDQRTSLKIPFGPFLAVGIASVFLANRFILAGMS